MSDAEVECQEDRDCQGVQLRAGKDRRWQIATERASWVVHPSTEPSAAAICPAPKRDIAQHRMRIDPGKDCGEQRLELLELQSHNVGCRVSHGFHELLAGISRSSTLLDLGYELV